MVAGRYRLVECIGAGSMGVVWRAVDLLLRVEVAVKAIWLGGRPAAVGLAGASLTGADRARVAAAVREARSAAQLRSNPHVVSVTDVVEDGGLPWIVMELVAATSLDTAVRETGPLPVVRAAEVGLAVLDALMAGQRIGLLHRDVKPSNILLAVDGRVLLTDFGIATHVADTTAPGSDGSAGTPAYLAPERITQRPASLAADLFSLGATLYFAVDGNPPFARDTVPLTLGAVLHADPPPLVRADALWPVIGGLLIRNPEARLSAEAAKALLDRALRLTGAEAGTGSSGTGGTALAGRLATRGSASPERSAPSADPGGPVDPVDPVASLGPTPAGDQARPVGRADRSPPGRPGSWPRHLPPPPRPLIVGVLTGLVLVLVTTGLLWMARGGEPGPDGDPTPVGPSSGGGPSSGDPSSGPRDLLPTGMAGSWGGSVTQGPVEFPVELVLSGGGIDEIVGRGDYPTDGCSTELRLREVGPDSITVQERLVQDGFLCRGADRLVLALRSDGRLAYTYAATTINSVGNGVLTRE